MPIITQPLIPILFSVFIILRMTDNRSPRARHWAFTLNNYSINDESSIQSAFDAGGIDYIVFGKEVGSSGTPHYQGHVQFSTQKRLSQVLKLLPQAHYSVARDIKRSIEYAKKDGTFTEYGTPPDVCQRPGARNDLVEFQSAVKSGMVDFKELREAYPLVMARYPRFTLMYVRDHRPLPAVPDIVLRNWQSLLLETIDAAPDDRTINFVVDEKGNAGKSTFAFYLEQNRSNVQVMKCAKRDDMAFDLDESSKIFIIDVSRAMSKFLNYQFLEDVKDGHVFSPKYESYTKRFPRPHVVVMMNEMPDTTILSEDRYVFYPVD